MRRQKRPRVNDLMYRSDPCKCTMRVHDASARCECTMRFMLTGNDLALITDSSPRGGVSNSTLATWCLGRAGIDRKAKLAQDRHSV